MKPDVKEHDANELKRLAGSLVDVWQLLDSVSRMGNPKSMQSDTVRLARMLQAWESTMKVCVPVLQKAVEELNLRTAGLLAGSHSWCTRQAEGGLVWQREQQQRDEEKVR